jgi:trk system potassium uptake protein TrkA
MRHRIFIIGGGRFGTHLAGRLSEFGSELVIADNDAKRVAELSEDGFHAIQLEADDGEALKEANVSAADVVVVALGESMEASILSTLLLKELKVKRVIARAIDVKHAQVLEKLGADFVILPSRDMAYRLAERLRARYLSDRLPISEHFQLAHIRIAPKLVGKEIGDLHLPDEYGITVLLISRPQPASETEPEPKPEDIEPKPATRLEAGDILIVSGARKNIDRFEEECGQAEPEEIE